MAFDITRQEILKQAIALNKLWKQTRDQKYRDEELRLRRIAIELENVQLTGGGGAVDRIIAGTNISISPIGGTGDVTINATTLNPDPTGYGSFYSTQNQSLTAVDTPQIVTFNNTYEANDISLASNRIYFAKAGTYQFAYVAQIFNSSNDIQHCEFWIKYNGVDFPNSATHITVNARKSSTEPSEQQMKLILSGTAQNDGDYIELYWQGSSNELQLGYVAPGVDGPVGSPSVIANIIPIGAQGRDSNLNELNDVLITNPQPGDVLNYDSVDGIWVNGPSGLGEVDPNEGLEITEGSLGTIYNTTITDTVNSVAVGGATAQPASFWKSKSLVQVLDTILFPTILPSILTNKSVSLTISETSGTLEIGQTILRTLTASFNLGSIRNGDGTTNPNPLVGLATQYTFTGTGIGAPPVPQASNTFGISNTIVSGSNNWAVTVNYDAGTGLYYDNKGNVEDNLDASRVAGTTTDSSSSPTVTGIYPYFWGVSDTLPTPSSIAAIVQAGTANKVVLSASGTVTVNFNATDKYLWMVHPSVYTTKTKWYVTALNNGNIGSPSDLFGLVNTQVINSPNSYWTGINYTVYVSTFKTSLSVNLEFRNS